ncbi:hypothetical protein AN639_00375 [Candidatus Epulonipiscium fishelsonii]|uniref:Uncharacterized protein n=1 Tax=Candidatus Epulonipiscium fishelsonii TaxID=77094 RepID=A0ACC8XD76_9FIRM|nr:hypothetical protein AN396_05405 [Epulopiscium sp. SCG-B11WGA-EpuloA1]ONI41841.1 hypothetical protein AN639_00375 [Epulopiscium sp. SCG-B05WGA-EpuloA1]
MFKKIFIMIMSCVLLIGCGSSAEPESGLFIEESLASNIAMDSAPMMDMASISMKSGAGSNSVMPDMQFPNRKIIKSGRVSIETLEFDNSINYIFEEVEQLGGFIELYEVDGSGEQYKDYDSSYSNAARYATVKARIPENMFTQFINTTEKYGMVVYKSIESEDITDQYVDTELRIETLTIQQERLTELLEKSGTLTEIFEIEKELANVLYELESFQGTLNQYDSLVDFATVTIYIDEVYKYEEQLPVPKTFSERISVAFSDMIDKFIENTQNAVVLLIYGIPLIVIAVLILVIIKIIIKSKKNK